MITGSVIRIHQCQLYQGKYMITGSVIRLHQCQRYHYFVTCPCVSQGYNNEARAYIATQGPMEHTINDFWRMVWNEKVPIIIMITKLKEKNKVSRKKYL